MDDDVIMKQSLSSKLVCPVCVVEAEKLGVGSIATDNRLTQTLEEAGFKIDKHEKRYTGEWLRNPMDLLPFEGDCFAHSLVQAHKK